MDHSEKELNEIIKEREEAYMSHFEKELNIMRAQVEKDDELIIEPYVDVIKQVCKTFAKVGWDSGTAPMAATVLSSTLKAILGFQILSPLTGEDSEWDSRSKLLDDDIYQNNRDTSVFKESDGRCSFNNAIIWQGEEIWDRFHGVVENIGSSHYIKEFPFMPRTFIIDVYSETFNPTNPKHLKNQGKTEIYFIKDPKQLEEVFKYYDKKEIDLTNKKETNDKV